MFDNLYLKKGIIYIIVIHIVSFLSTLVIVLVLPKLFSVADYGYWQEYTLYTGYVGLAHLGFMDGIYLKLLGKSYDNLDINILKNNFITQLIIQTLFSLVFCIYCLLSFDGQKLILLLAVVFSIPIINLRAYFQYILQATGEIKSYSILQVSDRVSLVGFILLLFLFNKSYIALVVGDLLSKILLLLISMYMCRNIVFFKYKYSFDKDEFIDTISIGIKIMIANFCGSLLMGISKFFVDGNFSIEMYSQYSLSLTLTSLFVSVLASIGIVLLPYIKNLNDDNKKNTYILLHSLTSLIVLFGMMFYQPVSLILTDWLPNYKSSFELLSILLPILFFESQFNLIDSIYMKALRMEKDLMRNYLVSTFVVYVLTYISLTAKKDLTYISFALLLSYMIRNILCQTNLLKILHINTISTICKYVISSIFFPILFCISNIYIKGFRAMIVFLVVYLIYFSFSFNYISIYIKSAFNRRKYNEKF